MTAVVVNQAALDVATLTQRMTSEYFSHVAAMHVARDPRAATFAPPIEPGQIVPVLRVPRRDGTNMVLSFHHYLLANHDLQTRKDFDQVWLRGALLTVGDALGAHGYFGHEPEAEIVRHLRNGIAHGNRFTFNSTVVRKDTGRLKYPANIFRYAARQVMPLHEIDTHLQGTEALGTWGGPDAIIDCLTVLGVHLWNLGHGISAPL